MPADRIEDLLRAAPPPAIDPRREAQLIAAILAAHSRTPWWRRGVPLWQAAAACVAFASLGLLWSGQSAQTYPGPTPDASATTPTTTQTPQAPPEPHNLRVAANVFTRDSTAHRLDISHWKPVTNTKSGAQP